MGDTTVSSSSSTKAKSERALKVVVVEPKGDGGLCHYSYNLCRALADYGCEVHLITGAPYELAQFPKNFKVHEYNLRSVSGLRASWKCLKALRPDIVHQQGTNLHPLFEWVYMWASRLYSGAAYVYTCHLAIPHEIKAREMPFVGYKLRSAEAIIVHSDRTADEAKQHFNVRADHLHVIPHGDYRFFRGLGDLGKGVPFTKVEGTKDILFFGAVRQYKGLMFLIEAIGKMRQKGLPVRLMVVGKERDDWPEYVAAMEKWGVKDSTLLNLAYIDMEDVPGFFEFADCSCLPYLDGSESGVLQLADAFDKPIVATETGGNAEAFEEGLIQGLVPPKDSDALAKELERVLFEESFDEFLAKKAARGSGKRAWPGIAIKTVDLYNLIRKQR